MTAARISQRSSELLRSGLWVGLKILGQGIEFIGWVVLANRLALGDLGVLAAFTLAARYLGLVGDWGAHHVGPRVVVEADVPGSQVIPNLQRHRLLLTAVLTVFFAIGAAVLGYGELAPVGLLAFHRGANRDWVALGRSQHNRSAVPSVVLGTGVLVAALAGDTASDVAIGFGLAGAAAFILSIAFNRVEPVDDPTALRLPQSVGWIMVMTLADQLLASVDIGIIALFRSPEEVGIYSSVYRLPNALLLVVGLAVAVAVAPMRRSASESGSLPQIRRRLLNVGVVGAATSLTIGVPLVLAVTAIFGDDFGEGRTPVAILFVASAAIAWSAPYRVFLLSFGNERTLAKTFLAGAVANLAANVVLVPAFGMVGAASATLVVQLCTTVALFAQTRDRLRRPLGEIEELANTKRAEAYTEHLV